MFGSCDYFCAYKDDHLVLSEDMRLMMAMTVVVMAMTVGRVHKSDDGVTIVMPMLKTNLCPDLAPVLGGGEAFKVLGRVRVSE